MYPVQVLAIHRRNLGNSFFALSQPRHSAYSFFLPAWILPTCTFFTPFTGFPPMLPSSLPPEVLIRVFPVLLLISTVGQWRRVQLHATMWSGVTHHIDYKYSSSQTGKEIKALIGLCFDTQVGNLLNNHTAHTSSHSWPELDTARGTLILL